MKDSTKKTMLVIDDDDDLREILEAMLKRMGYHVLTAANGDTAVRLARSYNGTIDGAILDLFLPDIRGDKVCPEIQKLYPGLKIILMSGYGLKDTAVLSVDVNGFFQKPGTYQELKDTLDTVFVNV